MTFREHPQRASLEICDLRLDTWLHLWQLRTTIWTSTLWPLNTEWWWQHSQFLRCFLSSTGWAEWIEFCESDPSSPSDPSQPRALTNASNLLSVLTRSLWYFKALPQGYQSLQLAKGLRTSGLKISLPMWTSIWGKLSVQCMNFYRTQVSLVRSMGSSLYKGDIQKTKTGKIASKKYNSLGPPPTPPLRPFLPQSGRYSWIFGRYCIEITFCGNSCVFLSSLTPPPPPRCIFWTQFFPS